MINNRCIKKLIFFLLLCFVICIVSVDASSMTFTDYEKIKDAFLDADRALERNNTDFVTLKSERDDLKGAYDANAEEIRDQGIAAAYQGVSFIFIAKLGPLAGATAVQELRDAITRAHLTALDLDDQDRLSKALDIAINKTQELRNTIGEPQSGTQQATGLFLARDEAYKAYVDAYKAYHGSPSATPTLKKGPNSPVIDNVIFSYGCFGSDTCEESFSSPLSAMTSHFTKCEEKPHKEEEFGWYSCESDSCPKPEPHWRLCPGACLKKFEPFKQYIGSTTTHYEYYDNFPHEVRCIEKVYTNFIDFIFNFCWKKYDDSLWYTCEHKKCPNSTHHRPDMSEDSGAGSALSLSPSNGSSYTAFAGDPHTIQLSILSKSASISFYVITPNDAINVVSTYLSTASGDGTSTAATASYTFPEGVSGDYEFYVSIGYTDGTSESPNPSYTVSVSLPSSTETTTTSTETTASTTPTPSTPSSTPSEPTVPAVPVWSGMPGPYNLSAGDSFYLDLSSYVTDSTNISQYGGSMPSGLSVSSDGVLSGTLPEVIRSGTLFVSFRASNAAGFSDSGWITFVITGAGF